MSCCGEHELVATGSSYLFGLWASSPYVTTLVLGPPLLALLLIYPALILLTPGETQLPPSAFEYTTSSEGKSDKHALPQLARIGADDDEIQLSIVIPAYNEQDRLPQMLKEAAEHLQMLRADKKTLSGQSTNALANGSTNKNLVHHALTKPLQSFEILIVDDGSCDATAKVALQFAKDNNLEGTIRLIRLGRNCGKGKAVRHGVLHSRGALIAFCDADGATRFADISNLAKEMQRIATPAGHGIVCGSRAHLVGSEAVIKRSFVRNFLMHSFHFILSLLMRPPNPVAYVQARLPSFLRSSSLPGSRTSLPLQPPVRDTQCGFKLFTRASAQAVFPLAHIDRWIFDVELLLLAEKASYVTLRRSAASAAEQSRTATNGIPADPLLRLPLPIAEVAVDWREVEGSKIDILKDSIKMGIDLLVIRLNYAFGRWKSPGVLPATAGQEAACCR